MAISSSSLLLNMWKMRSFVSRWPADGSLLRQFLQAQPDQLRSLGLLAGVARSGGDGGGSLWLTVAEIDQRGNRIGHRARRAVIVDRAGEMHHGGIDVGEGRRLVLQLADDALGHFRADAGRARYRGLVA